MPFETDTAVTRHVAAFLRALRMGGIPARPTHLLFNGGVFRANPFRQRLSETVADSAGDALPPNVLEGEQDLDFAVARGAAAYGWTKLRSGLRIRGGTARSYFVVIESAGLAIPGAPRLLRAQRFVPFGMKEGTEANVPSGDFGLVVGEPAVFRPFSSSVSKGDKPGTLLPAVPEDELAETDLLEATLPATTDRDEHFVPVRFESKVTEFGMF